MFLNLPLTRRRLFLLSAALYLPDRARVYAAGSDFWNKKEPADWSSEEIDKLVTRSPWARQVTAAAPINRQYGGGSVGMPDPSPGGGYPGGGNPGAGGLGYPGGAGGGRRRSSRSADMPTYTATVRWESAAPVLQALKIPLPETLAGDYVISVNGVPILTRGRTRADDDDADNTVSHGMSDAVLDRIKELTYLQPKGKPAAQPAAVIKGPLSSKGLPGLLFGFPKDILPLTADDREVSFTTTLGAIEVKTKFNLKDMMYRNELAL